MTTIPALMFVFTFIVAPPLLGIGYVEHRDYHTASLHLRFDLHGLSPFLVCVVPPVAASVAVLLRYQEGKDRANTRIAQGSQGAASPHKRLQGVDYAGVCGPCTLAPQQATGELIAPSGV